jgi:hypothetical protein
MSLNWKITVLLFGILITSSCSSALQSLETVPVKVTATLVETIQPSILSTKSLVPSSTPTLSTTQTETKLLQLLRGENCHLPCFLGIVPGQTDESQATSTLSQFDEISPGTEIRFSRDDLVVSLDVITENGYSKDHPEVVKWIDAKTSVYRQLDTSRQKIYQNPYYKEYFQKYTLPYLLSTYGPPEQAYVFLDTGIADMGLGIDLYLLHLDYPDQGWVAHLEMPLHLADGLFLGCPSEAFTNLRLWSPDTPARDYELDSEVLFTIEEATGLTLEEFYQEFKDPTTTECLETPSNLHK